MGDIGYHGLMYVQAKDLDVGDAIIQIEHGIEPKLFEYTVGRVVYRHPFDVPLGSEGFNRPGVCVLVEAEVPSSYYGRPVWHEDYVCSVRTNTYPPDRWLLVQVD